MKRIFKDPREWIVSGLLLVFALAFHAYFAIELWHWPIHLYGDSVHYDHAAVVLLLKHIYTYWSWGPAAQVTPGYPLFLEFCYWFTLVSTHNHQVQMHIATTFQHLLAAVTVLFLYRIMRKGLPRYASVAASLLWLVYPPATSAANQILTETLYVFFLVCFAWTFLCAIQKPSIARYILAGFILGLTTLVRPSVMPLAAAVLVVFFSGVNRQQIKRHVWHVCAYIGMFVLTMLPWWIRNVVSLHRFILTDEDLANPLLYGSDPNFAQDPGLASGLTGAQQKALALHRIAVGFEHHPLLYLKWYTIDKIGLLFGTPWFTSVKEVPKWIDVYANTHLVWVISGALGLLIIALRRDALWWISALVAFLVVVQLPFIPIDRYAFPIMPFLFVGVGYCIGYFSWVIREALQAVIDARSNG